MTGDTRCLLRVPRPLKPDTPLYSKLVRDNSCSEQQKDMDLSIACFQGSSWVITRPRASGQEALETLRVGSGRVGSGQVGSTGLEISQIGSIGSKGFENSRVGLGWVGSGWVMTHEIRVMSRVRPL